MAGRKPDFDVMVPVGYVAAGGVEKTQWHNVGAGWSSDSGSIAFNIVNQPNVRYVLVKRKEKEKEEAA